MKRKQIIMIALFVLFVFAGDRIAGGLMEKLFLKTKFRYGQLYSGNLPGEICVLGDSRGLHMFHPPSIEAETSKSVANLAFNGNPATVLPVLWEDYLARHDAPKLLILEVSCAGQTALPGSHEGLSVLADQNPRFNQLIAEQNPTNGWANRISRLFRYNSDMMWRSLLFLKSSDQAWIMESTLNESMMEIVVNESDNELGRIPANVAALREILALAKESGIEVKCVVAPYLPAFHKRLKDPDGWRNWLEQELDHEILDYAQLLDDTKNFADHLHLNETGAKELAAKLNAIGFFD